MQISHSLIIQLVDRLTQVEIKKLQSVVWFQG